MGKVYTITDPRVGKTRRIKDLRVVSHQLPNGEGEMHAVPCVEFMVIGHNHEWPLWLTLEDFRRANPHMHV